MQAVASSESKTTVVPTLNRLHGLLTVQTAVVILVSINRLSSLTAGYVAENQFLRWVDFHNMLTLPLIGLVSFYLLKKHMELELGAPKAGVANGRWHLLINLTFIVGIYLLGAGYGDHEVTNYLNGRFCTNDNSTLCQIIVFNDDEFSHWVFFLGFVLINAALMLLQVLFPYAGKLTRRDMLLLLGNGLFIGLGVFANLAFETIGFDLYVIALLAAFVAFLLWWYRWQPLLVYYGVAYWFGLVGTAVYKFVV